MGDVLEGSHGITQNEAVVNAMHVAVGDVTGDVAQSAFVMHVLEHAYALMAPPPKENGSHTSPVPVHPTPDAEHDVA